MTRLLIQLSLSLLLFSCASRPVFDSTNIDWNTHYANAASLQQWSLRGRLNVRSDNDSETASFNWDQSGDIFTIHISGPLGLGAIRIEGNDQFVLIEKSGEPPIVANSLEEISSAELGFVFPASELYYWIRGIPAPALESQQHLLENNLLKTLSQEDQHQRNWQLEFDRYQDNAGMPLPGRIKIENSNYRLTIFAIRWQLDSL